MRILIGLTLTLLAACEPTRSTPAPAPDTGRTDEPPAPDSPTDTGDGPPRDTSVEAVPSSCDETRWPDVRLNELVAANLESLIDAAEESPDWVELVNRSGGDVDLDGWKLRNGDDEIWTFAPLTLSDDEILVVLASGEASQGDPDLGEEVHAGIKIDAFDASIELLSPDDCVKDQADAGRIYGDVSYGRSQDDPGAWEYFLEPTPGAENSTKSKPGFADPPSISPGSGMYDTRVEVTITPSDPEDELRYTTDATEPDEDSARYDEPFDVLATDAAAVVRARAYRDGLWPSRVESVTLFPDDEPLEAGMYTVALVVEPDDLWSDDRGIYAWGEEDYETTYPYFGANFWEPWERPARVTVWDASGNVLLDQEAGIAIHGGYTRAFDQKSLRVVARSAYGPETFAAPLFSTEDLDEFEWLVLQIGMDWCSTHIQEVVPQALLRDPDGKLPAGADMGAWEPAQVWLNGEYWGYYNLRERTNGAWIEQHHGVDREQIDRVELGWTHDANWELEQGDWEAFDALNAYVIDADLSDEATWEGFDAMVDLESLATTVLIEAYMVNSDWWGNNLRLWRPRTDDGQWRWMAYDFGHGWGNPAYDHFGYSAAWTGDGLPIADALENEAFQNLVANLASDLLNTGLGTGVARERLDEIAARVEPAMDAQFERWCPTYGDTAWEEALVDAQFFVDKRTDNLRAQVGRNLGHEDTATLRLETSPPEAGQFTLTAITTPAPFEGQYYQGVPVPVTAVAAEGWRFVGWEDASLGTDATVLVELDGDTTVTAVFEAE